MEAALEAYGRIDGIAHNASTSPNLTTTDQLSSEDLLAIMQVNPMAGLWMARAAWPHLVRQHYGRILYATSAGVYGSFGNAHYAAAKAAYFGMLRCLAVEGAEHGILVNGMAPSARTRMTERFQPSPYADWFFDLMSPEKVAVGSVYLLSAECPVNGEILSLGGGRVGRIVIAENRGAIGNGNTIEEVRELVARAMADTDFFYPKDLAERSEKVSGFLGFTAEMVPTKGIAIRPIEE